MTRKVLHVAVNGTFLGMKFQIPAMLASGGGAIVNMASIAGARHRPDGIPATSCSAAGTSATA